MSQHNVLFLFKFPLSIGHYMHFGAESNLHAFCVQAGASCSNQFPPQDCIFADHLLCEAWNIQSLATFACDGWFR
jgi:hypothetical protein